MKHLLPFLSCFALVAFLNSLGGGRTVVLYQEDAVNFVGGREFKKGSFLPAMALYNGNGRREAIRTDGDLLLIFQSCGCAALKVDNLVTAARTENRRVHIIWPESMHSASNPLDLYIGEDDLMMFFSNRPPEYSAVWCVNGRITKVEQN